MISGVRVTKRTGPGVPGGFTAKKWLLGLYVSLRNTGGIFISDLSSLPATCQMSVSL